MAAAESLEIGAGLEHAGLGLRDAGGGEPRAHPPLVACGEHSFGVVGREAELRGDVCRDQRRSFVGAERAEIAAARRAQAVRGALRRIAERDGARTPCASCAAGTSLPIASGTPSRRAAATKAATR